MRFLSSLALTWFWTLRLCTMIVPLSLELLDIGSLPLHRCKGCANAKTHPAPALPLLLGEGGYGIKLAPGHHRIARLGRENAVLEAAQTQTAG
jgi:hypothetical protein